MKEVILIFQIISSVLLSIAILVQVKGTGFGRVWGGMSNSFSRRGLEGLVFKLTFVLSFIFIGLSIIAVVV